MAQTRPHAGDRRDHRRAPSRTPAGEVHLVNDDADLNLGAWGADAADDLATGELPAPTHWPSLPASTVPGSPVNGVPTPISGPRSCNRRRMRVTVLPCGQG